MRQHRAVVGIGIEASTAFGRRIMHGAMRYANIRREWILAKEFNVGTTDASAWPMCEGGIVTVSDEPLIGELRKRCRHLLAASGGGDPAVLPVVSMDDVAIGRPGGESTCWTAKLEKFIYYGWPGKRVSDNRQAGFAAALEKQGFSFTVCPIHFELRRQLGGDDKSCAIGPP